MIKAINHSDEVRKRVTNIQFFEKNDSRINKYSFNIEYSLKSGEFSKKVADPVNWGCPRALLKYTHISMSIFSFIS